MPVVLPGARSATQSGEVFLGGNYLEVGIGADGGFGTLGAKPAGFFGTSGDSGIGLSNDADGFGAGTDLRIDYFLPGTPEERWAVGYNGSAVGSYSTRDSDTGAALSDVTLVDQSGGDTLQATFAATVGGALRVQQVISFDADDKYFKNTVVLTNLTGAAMSDVRFMRSFDPDNTVYYGGDYTTVNTVDRSVAVDGFAVVSAQSLAGDAYYTASGGQLAALLLLSGDPRAYGSAFGFTNTNPYVSDTTGQAKGYTITTDGGIAMTYVGDSLAAGASVTFVYYTSLDAGNIDDIIQAIGDEEDFGCPAEPNVIDGTAKVDKLTGTECADIISGFAGNDILKGQEGNDVIDGGVGMDKMYGGLGDDTFYVDHGSDFAVEFAGEGNDTVITTLAKYTLASHVENLIYNGGGSTALTGNALDNVITTLEGSDTLDGGKGADTMTGGAGGDTYIVDNALDVVEEEADEGTDTVKTSLNDYTLSDNVENLTYTGKTASSLNGNGLDNVIIGGVKNDTLDGGEGDDALYGGAGNDILTGGTGEDAFFFNTAPNAGSNVDTITDFESGSDMIHLENAIFKKLGAAGALTASMFVVGTAALDGNDYLIYDDASGKLYYDADGSGRGKAIQIALVGVDDHPELSAADFAII
jgi:Ca2+-binding RTX toxin-like protein